MISIPSTNKLENVAFTDRIVNMNMLLNKRSASITNPFQNETLPSFKFIVFTTKRISYFAGIFFLLLMYCVIHCYFPVVFVRIKTFSYLKVIFEDVSFEIKFDTKNTARPSSQNLTD